MHLLHNGSGANRTLYNFSLMDCATLPLYALAIYGDIMAVITFLKVSPPMPHTLLLVDSQESFIKPGDLSVKS